MLITFPRAQDRQWTQRCLCVCVVHVLFALQARPIQGSGGMDGRHHMQDLQGARSKLKQRKRWAVPAWKKNAWHRFMRCLARHTSGSTAEPNGKRPRRGQLTTPEAYRILTSTRSATDPKVSLRVCCVCTVRSACKANPGEVDGHHHMQE